MLLSAQDWQWIKRGGSTSTISTTSYRQEEVYDMHTDSEQNVYIISSVGWWSINIDGNPKEYYGNTAFENPNYALTSFSCDGTYRWSKIIGGGGQSQNPPYFQVGSNDNIYVAGKFGSCNGMDSYPPRIEDDIILPQSQSSCQTLFLVKFDTDGNLLWLKQPQEPGHQTDVLSNTLSRDFTSDEAGNLYWAVFIPPGIYANGAFVNTQEGVNYFILKYNTAGDFLEAIPIDITVELYGVSNLKFYRNPYNGNFYFTSRLDPTQENATVGGQPVNHSFFLASFDEQGNFLWKRENTSTTYAFSIQVYNLAFDSSNNIYLGGKLTGFEYQDSFLGFYVDGDISPSYVMKTDPTAENLLWASHSNGLGAPPAINSNGNGKNDGAIIVANDEVIFTGGGRGQGYTWAGQTLDINLHAFDVVFARFDVTTGNCLELTHIPSNDNNSEGGTALAVDAAGDYLVGGGFSYNLIDAAGNEVYNVGGQSDFFVAKYATQDCNTPVASVEGFGYDLIKAYPNPTKSSLSIEVQQPTRYQLFTLNGQLLAKGKLNKTQNNISLENLSSGLYLLELQTKDGKKQTLKVVKE
ncbi:T9SS type A sorting domain-containing protein [Haloflavibacter putidus]|nr:T9SS type A sorting domain-containing protein [Haloflavibacter putidus]